MVKKTPASAIQDNLAFCGVGVLNCIMAVLVFSPFPIYLQYFANVLGTMDVQILINHATPLERRLIKFPKASSLDFYSLKLLHSTVKSHSYTWVHQIPTFVTILKRPSWCHLMRSLGLSWFLKWFFQSILSSLNITKPQRNSIFSVL